MAALQYLPYIKNWFSFLKRLTQRLLFVGRNSSFHGVNNLFQENGSLLSRVIWLLVIILSLGGLYLMMEPAVELGVEINYTPDTFYLDWTTTFPGVTVCENPRTNKVQKKFEALYPDLLKPLKFDHRRFLSDLVYARKQCSHAQCDACGSTIACDVPWRQIIERIHTSCDEMLTDCSYNGEEFPCCHLFRSVDSEHGPCFAFNTLQHKNSMPLRVMNRSTGPGTVKFRLLSDAEISIHSSEELSTNKLDVKLKNTIQTNIFNNVEWSFSIVEIENDRLLMNERIDERRCRFVDEIPEKRFHTYPVYSHGACVLAYNTEETFDHCGCIHPVRDLTYKEHYCNYTGMNCWNNFEDLRIQLGSEKSNRISECLPSCVESELTTINFWKNIKYVHQLSGYHNTSYAYCGIRRPCKMCKKILSYLYYVCRGWIEEENEKPGTMVAIKMIALPTLRYQRNLIKTHLDLVVAVGGIAGLFFSASILSFLEVFYLIFRPQKFNT